MNNNDMYVHHLFLLLDCHQSKSHIQLVHQLLLDQRSHRITVTVLVDVFCLCHNSKNAIQHQLVRLGIMVTLVTQNSVIFVLNNLDCVFMYPFQVHVLTPIQLLHQNRLLNEDRHRLVQKHQVPVTN